MRLIDADKLIEAMKKTETEYKNAMRRPSWRVAFIVINEQPTAYNVDKVVEELEALVKEYDERIERRNGDCYYDEIKKIKALDERARGVEKAIEIVKPGGVRKDVESD